MALRTTMNLGGLTLTEVEERRIRRHLQALARRLSHHPEPTATIVIRPHPGQRQTQADVRVQLGPLGPHLVSHQSAQTPDRAVGLAISDIERQLERRHALQRGEPAFGVPSRRAKAMLVVAPPSSEAAEGESAEGAG